MLLLALACAKDVLDTSPGPQAETSGPIKSQDGQVESHNGQDQLQDATAV